MAYAHYSLVVGAVDDIRYPMMVWMPQDVFFISRSHLRPYFYRVYQTQSFRSIIELR